MTLSAAAVAVLDAMVAGGHAATHSAAAEVAIMAWFAAMPRPGSPGAPKSRRTK